jgi:hypothetical protein
MRRVIACFISVIFATMLCGLAYGQSEPAVRAVLQAKLILVDDPDDLFSGQITVDSAVSGEVVLEPSALDLSNVPAVGVYQFGKESQIRLRIAGLDFGSVSSEQGLVVEVIDDQPKPRNEGVHDVFLLRSSKNQPVRDGVLVEEISWQLEDADGRNFSGDLFPAWPLDLAAWKSVYGLSIKGRTEKEPGSSFVLRAVVTELRVIE